MATFPHDTLLVRASKYRFTRLIELLLRRGADIDLQGDHGDTALAVAAFAGDSGIVQLLLDANGRTDLRDVIGMTALEAAQASASLSSTPPYEAKRLAEAARLIEQHEHAVQAQIQERAREARALAEQQAQQAVQLADAALQQAIDAGALAEIKAALKAHADQASPAVLKQAEQRRNQLRNAENLKKEEERKAERQAKLLRQKEAKRATVTPATEAASEEAADAERQAKAKVAKEEAETKRAAEAKVAKAKAAKEAAEAEAAEAARAAKAAEVARAAELKAERKVRKQAAKEAAEREAAAAKERAVKEAAANEAAAKEAAAKEAAQRKAAAEEAAAKRRAAKEAAAKAREAREAAAREAKEAAARETAAREATAREAKEAAARDAKEAAVHEAAASEQAARAAAAREAAAKQSDEAAAMVEAPAVQCRPLALPAAELADATASFAPGRKIGEGGFGSVFKALPLPSLPQHTVAVKRLAAEAGAAELRAELEILSRCAHAHLLPLLGYSIDARCLVYPLARGGSLDDRLFRTPDGLQRLAMLGCHAPPPLPWQHRVRILRDTVRALVYLHREARPAVFHGDVKPPNILLDAAGNALLADVGLAKQAELGRQTLQTHCTIQAPRGTPGYLDPLMMNELVHSEVTDGYAAGITMLVTLTGKPAVGLHAQCRSMLRFPDSPDKWQAPGVPDAAAGEWPTDVVSKLASLVVGTSLSAFKEDRTPLPEALSELEAIASAASEAVPPLQGADDTSAAAAAASPASASPEEARSCVICLDKDREVRFACGHCVA